MLRQSFDPSLAQLVYFPDAIKVAFEMMLQEDFGHATSRLLALYACSQYLNKEMDNLLAPVTDDNKPTLDDDEEDYVVSRASVVMSVSGLSTLTITMVRWWTLYPRETMTDILMSRIRRSYLERH